ncbi:hypothetical protein [Rhodococcus sp. IEGM 1408]|uniref:hypothetical protein n=1 Tax=Rhodococcus sp. IEGM 1408 TaxID=3082220 RepID=UPI002954D500|nr:hypothetical protein [Rhodococcus sp. IEGM 1408]MDV8002795.1 hypothetical protein [Rhodococcus sp. IEGM 1408]
MAKRLISIPDDVDRRLGEAVPSGQISGFVTEQIKRGLDEQSLRSMDDAIAHIARNSKPLLDRLGNVSDLDT